MAAGNGFSTSPMGFNKNEVNEYIASISKRMSELETEKKEIEKKYESVKKVVDGADDKANMIEAVANERIAKLEEEIKTERKNSEELIDQIDELKRKLKNAISSAGAAAKASGGAVNTAAAEKKSAEIIASAEKTAKETVAKANKTAAEVVEKAKRTASEIVSGAGSARANKIDVSGFLKQLREFAESVNRGVRALSDKAEELGEGGAAAEMPDLSSFAAPQTDFAQADTIDNDFDNNFENDFGDNTDFVSDYTSDNDSGTSGGIDEINALLESMSGDSKENNDMGGDFADMFGNMGDDTGNDMGGDDMDAGFGFGAMDDVAEEPKTDDTDMGGFDDLDGGFAANDMDISEESASEDVFGMGDDLLSGFTDSADETEDEMGVELTADFADAVEADDVNLTDSLDTGMSNEMDEMQKLLEQAELTFGGGSSEFEERTADASEDAADDWSSLQNELDALEQQNDTVDDMGSDSAADGEAENDIWSLGDVNMGDSDDDDMSGDLFGSF